MDVAFRHVFVRLVDERDWPACSALSRTCRAFHRQWVSVRWHELLIKVARLYRGIVLIQLAPAVHAAHLTFDQMTIADANGGWVLPPRPNASTSDVACVIEALEHGMDTFLTGAVVDALYALGINIYDYLHYDRRRYRDRQKRPLPPVISHVRSWTDIVADAEHHLANRHEEELVQWLCSGRALTSVFDDDTGASSSSSSSYQTSNDVVSSPYSSVLANALMLMAIDVKTPPCHWPVALNNTRPFFTATSLPTVPSILFAADIAQSIVGNKLPATERLRTVIRECVNERYSLAAALAFNATLVRVYGYTHAQRAPQPFDVVSDSSDALVAAACPVRESNQWPVVRTIVQRHGLLLGHRAVSLADICVERVLTSSVRQRTLDDWASSPNTKSQETTDGETIAYFAAMRVANRRNVDVGDENTMGRSEWTRRMVFNWRQCILNDERRPGFTALFVACARHLATSTSCRRVFIDDQATVSRCLDAVTVTRVYDGANPTLVFWANAPLVDASRRRALAWLTLTNRARNRHRRQHTLRSMNPPAFMHRTQPVSRNDDDDNNVHACPNVRGLPMVSVFRRIDGTFAADWSPHALEMVHDDQWPTWRCRLLAFFTTLNQRSSAYIDSIVCPMSICRRCGRELVESTSIGRGIGASCLLAEQFEQRMCVDE